MNSRKKRNRWALAGAALSILLIISLGVTGLAVAEDKPKAPPDRTFPSSRGSTNRASGEFFPSDKCVPWCSNTRPTKSCSLTIVESQQATEALTAADRSRSALDLRELDQFPAKALVVPLAMVAPDPGSGWP